MNIPIVISNQVFDIQSDIRQSVSNAGSRSRSNGASREYANGYNYNNMVGSGFNN